MKQKIVMKVHMNCQKCRTKALKVVAAASGVNFVGLEGEEKDKLVVIGDEVDPVKLTNSLRKKVGHTDIISLAEVKVQLLILGWHHFDCLLCSLALNISKRTQQFV
ncbi:hypothetical protein GLYMA_15G122200v4 [Glycine max]|nr:hypothetical protein GLYMA_15G122200v4 [Glycine max]